MSYLLEKLLTQIGPERLLDLLASDRSNWELAELLKIKAFQAALLRANFMAIYGKKKVSALRLVA